MKALDHFKNLANKRNLDPQTFFPFFLNENWRGEINDPDLQVALGHYMYRISGKIPVEERRKISIYPQEDGEILDEVFGRFYSLEQWRKDWEKNHAPIPFLKRELPSSLEELIQ